MTSMQSSMQDFAISVKTNTKNQSVKNKNPSPQWDSPFVYLLFNDVYNKRGFKACDVRQTAAYLGVCEDLANKHNAEITLLDDFK